MGGGSREWKVGGGALEGWGGEGEGRGDITISDGVGANPCCVEGCSCEVCDLKPLNEFISGSLLKATSTKAVVLTATCSPILKLMRIVSFLCAQCCRCAAVENEISSL